MAVDPSMMRQPGGMVPPPPMDAMMGPATPMPPAAPTPGGIVPPAVQALPGIADLAQQQTIQALEHERQMMMMQEKMQKDMMMLIASLPTKNPAGEAAVSSPSPAAMAPVSEAPAGY